MNARTILAAAGTSVALCAASTASAVNYTVDWMQLAPTPYGSPPPFAGTYTLPGIGTVGMTYTAHPDFTEARFQNGAIQTGNITYGPDNYAWTNHEALARTNWGFSGVLNTTWFVTYTFSNTVPAGNIILGVSGLGRRDPRPGENAQDCITVATVLQNGTHLGDWTNGNNWGATQFTGGAGTFAMQNSVTGPNGQDPWWNTGLALVRIDDAVTSLTVRMDQTAGDGVGVNIGVLVPTPGSAALLGMGGLLAVRRRRR